MTTSDYLEQLIQDRDDLVDNLTTKGISGLTGDETFTELVPEVLNIPSGGGAVEEKDVNFYDYDGTITNSYTAQEFLALSSMPDNPTHEGLTAQGWNWTLTDAQDYVTSYGKLNIGQMYVTDDGKTRIYIHLEDGRLEPYLGFAVNGTVTVDWGDNTTSTVTGTSTSTVISTKHTYASAGDYVISISNDSTIYLLGNGTYGSQVLWNNLTSANSSNRAYQNAIQKVELGNNVTSIGKYAFNNCCSLTTIIMPNIVTSITNYAFQYCYSLSNIIIPSSITSITSSAFANCYSLSSVMTPSSVTSITSSAFYNCYSLSSIIIPNGLTSIESSTFPSCYSLSNIIIPSSVTSIAGSAFSSCYSLSNIIIPSSVTSIQANAFNSCYSMAYYDFTASTVVPSLGYISAFNNIPTDCKIIVPDSLYADWIAATNWSTYADYIIKESEWND